MVKRWNKAATKILRQKIDSGEITLNNDSAQYLGDIVSGEHFPEYEAAPPSGRQTAIVRFRRLFRRIKLSRELQGQRLAARQGKLSLRNCLFDDGRALSTRNFIINAENAANNERGDYDEYEDRETDDDDDDDEAEEDDEEEDDDEDGDEEDMSRRTAPAATAGRKAATPTKAASSRSPPKKPKPASTSTKVATNATVGDVEQLAADFARAEVKALTFNFEARYPHIFIPTPPLSSGRASVVGYWLVPSVDQNRFFVEVSPDGMYSTLSMQIPRQFADVNSRVFLEVNQQQDQDASAIAAGFRSVQDQIIRIFADIASIRPSGQVDLLPFPCEQNPTLVHLMFEGDDMLQSRLLTDGDQNHQYLSIVRVIFQASEVLRHGNNYGRHQVFRSIPSLPHYQNVQFQQTQQHLAPQQQVPYVPQQQPPPQQQQQPPPQQQQQPLPQQQQQPPPQQQQQPPPPQQQPLPPPQQPQQQQHQPVPNGLYAAEMQRQARAAARSRQRQQEEEQRNWP